MDFSVLCWLPFSSRMRQASWQWCMKLAGGDTGGKPPYKGIADCGTFCSVISERTFFRIKHLMCIAGCASLHVAETSQRCEDESTLTHDPSNVGLRDKIKTNLHVWVASLDGVIYCHPLSSNLHVWVARFRRTQDTDPFHKTGPTS